MTPKALAARYAIQLTYLIPLARKARCKVEAGNPSGFQITTELGGKLHFDYFNGAIAYLNRQIEWYNSK